MTQLDWENYFRTLAALHQSLLHTTNQPHFFRGELDEFFSGLRSRVNYPALIFESSTLDIEGEIARNFQRRTLAIIVTKNHTRDDWSEISQALAQCETIAGDLLGRLLNDIDTDAVTSLNGVSVLDIHGEALQNPADKYVGWRFEFVVQEPVCLYHSTNFASE